MNTQNRNAAAAAQQTVDVLLVEDNDADAELTLRVLRKACREAVVQRVCSGEEALAKLFLDAAHRHARSDLPRLILLDCTMPLMNGVDLYAKVMAHQITRHIPIVMMICSFDEQESLSGYDLQISGFLRKPVAIENIHCGPVAAALHRDLKSRPTRHSGLC